MRWKFLFIKFRPDVWWFALAFLSKHVLLNLSFAISVDLTAQVSSVLCVLVAYSFLVCIFMPYRMPIANALEIVGNICTSYLCIILLTMEDNQRHEDTLAIIGATMTGIPLLLGIATLSHVASAACPRVRERQWDQHLQASVQFVQCVQVLSRMDQKLITACLVGLGDWDRKFLRQVTHTIHAELFCKPTRKRCSTGDLKNDEHLMKFQQNGMGNVAEAESPTKSKYIVTGVPPVHSKDEQIRKLTRRLSETSTTQRASKLENMERRYSEVSDLESLPYKASKEMISDDEVIEGQWQAPRELYVSMVTPPDTPHPGAGRCHNHHAPQPSTVGRERHHTATKH